jgi:hypothetical protein
VALDTSDMGAEAPGVPGAQARSGVGVLDVSADATLSGEPAVPTPVAGPAIAVAAATPDATASSVLARVAAAAAAATSRGGLTCTQCNAAPAVRKCAATGWRPACDACATQLEAEHAPVKALQGWQAMEYVDPAAPVPAPAPAAVEADAAAE